MLKTILSRLQNPKVIVAVGSGLGAILINTGVVTVAHINGAVDVINTVLGLGVTVGIFGNPDSHLLAQEIQLPHFTPMEQSSPEPVSPSDVQPVAVPYFTGGTTELIQPVTTGGK